MDIREARALLLDTLSKITLDRYATSLHSTAYMFLTVREHIQLARTVQ